MQFRQWNGAARYWSAYPEIKDMTETKDWLKRHRLDADEQPDGRHVFICHDIFRGHNWRDDRDEVVGWTIEKGYRLQLVNDPDDDCDDEYDLITGLTIDQSSGEALVVFESDQSRDAIEFKLRWC